MPADLIFILGVSKMSSADSLQHLNDWSIKRFSLAFPKPVHLKKQTYPNK